MGELSNYYTSLKAGTNVEQPVAQLHDVSIPSVAASWKSKAAILADKLADNCRKHLILDIYCKILPVDDDYKIGHQGQMCQDVDCMLAKKGMTPTQYLTSCFESTKAPFVEYLLRSTGMIGQTYLEAENAELTKAKADNQKLEDPKTPSMEDEETSDALVDITNDTEYDAFVDALKKKTIDKIVRDVSDIIDDKKDNADMQFNSESAVRAGLDYFQKALWQEDKKLPDDIQEEMIGMAIREATLREIDLAFNQASSFTEYASAIRYGKGILINEAAVNGFKARLG